MREYKSRFIIVTFVVVLTLLVLLGRLWHLQILKGDEYESFSLGNRIRFLRIPAPRGRILDRNGREIVINRHSFDLNVIPNDIKDMKKLALTLSGALGVEAKEIEDKITAAYKENRFKAAVIARDINRDQLAFLEARKGSIPSINIEVNHTRIYPYEKLSAAVLGYLGKATEEELKHYEGLAKDSMVGKNGVEKFWEGYLRGEDGFIQKVTDAFGRETNVDLFQKDLKNRNGVQGADIVLSISLELQKAAEEALGQRAGSVVIMDVRTGELLALVSHPTFDPGDFANGIEADKWKELMKDESFPLVNRATQGVYAPGSVFKIVTAAAGLKEGVINTNTMFYCPGRYRLGKKSFRCWKSSGHGWMNLHRAIVESCDVYFYNVAEKLGISRFAPHIRDFGFGAPTGIAFNEKSGTAPSEEWKLKNLKKPWFKGETVVTAIGQGYVNATPLQVAVMTAAVANGGTLLKPGVVKRVVSPNGRTLIEYAPESMGRLDVEDHILGVIRHALAAVVKDERGTGRAARVDGITVAGKTGTAQVVALGASNADKHRDHAWFTSYAPAESPEIAITVLVEHGGKGGAVAAPIVRQILEVYVKLKEGGNV